MVKKKIAIMFCFFTIFALAVITPLTQPQQTTRPPTPPLPISVETTDTLREIQYGDWTLVLRDLLLSHPHSDVREGMYQAIEEGALNLAITDDGEMLNSHSVAVFTVLPQEDGTVLRAMQIDPRTVMDPTIRTEFIQLVLLHEYQHYLQSLRPDEHLELMMLQTQASIKQQTPANIRWMIDNEVEAYVIECQFASEEGWVWAVEICNVYLRGGPSGLRRFLALEYMRQPMWSTHQETLTEISEEE